MAPRLTWKLELAALPLMVRPPGSAEASRVELVFRVMAPLVRRMVAPA